MITVKIIVSNPIQENTIVLSDQTKECIIIDAGGYTPQENKALSDYIESNGLKPVMAVNTHGHVDHMLGVNYVKERYGIPFAIDGRDAFLIESAPTHGAIYGFKVDSVPTIDIDLQGKKEVRFGDTAMEIIETPGHTPGHICLYNKDEKLLITGDTLFRESIGRTDLEGGSSRKMDESLRKFAALPIPKETQLLPGHGDFSTYGEELENNFYIRNALRNA